ncbi:hypothetical protein HYI19_18510 [Clostridium botulinum]|uniref:hypothetical protein n=1 Tax=Clostridium botulinum TaxID=1491 RepID=UPI000774299B|nr:hypothetical protein [Clostridium botulinum]MBN3369089.1 hypothetical protein [Clostridium botulinum]MBN3376115.1 hypothetical protein [Clostridium botulinum]MBY6846787.1 hypothetical protein [Clostridium botulinum]
MGEFELREWEKEQLVQKYNELKEEHEGIKRQLDEAGVLIDRLHKIKAECFEKMQGIRKVLLEKYNYPVV